MSVIRVCAQAPDYPGECALFAVHGVIHLPGKPVCFPEWQVNTDTAQAPGIVLHRLYRVHFELLPRRRHHGGRQSVPREICDSLAQSGYPAELLANLEGALSGYSLDGRKLRRVVFDDLQRTAAERRDDTLRHRRTDACYYAGAKELAHRALGIRQGALADLRLELPAVFRVVNHALHRSGKGHSRFVIQFITALSCH